MRRVGRAAESKQRIAAQPRMERAGSGAADGPFAAKLAGAHVAGINERIDEALAQINDLGSRLAQTHAMPDLRRYRQAIASLLRDLTAQMVQVKTQMEWDSQAWEHRTLVTIQKVDVELEHLTEMLLEQEKDRLAILASIGEIKGLLLDMRM